jgi:hypothetical protein
MSALRDVSRADWVKSSYSGGNGGQCVEFSRTFITPSGIVPVRDSKNPDLVLTFSMAEWRAFIEAIKNSEIPI